MNRFPWLSHKWPAAYFAAIVLASISMAGPMRAQNFAITTAPLSSAIEDVDSKTAAPATRGVKIDCITPDGQISPVASASGRNRPAIALLKDDDTLSCALPEGETTFIIALPSAAMLDRFTFVNENASARGELKIAVSNDQLPATSRRWIDVNGRIVFAQKRLFNLSMIGVDAKYVKLSFNVAKTPPLGGIAQHTNSSPELGDTNRSALKIERRNLLAED